MNAGARPSRPEDSPERVSGGGLLRPAAVGLCLLLAFAAGAQFVQWRAQRDELLEVLRGAGLDERDREAFERVARERTPHHARLTVAQALVNDFLTSDPAAAPPGSVLGEDRLGRLVEAQDLARRALAEQPSSWQAHMLLGAAIYLERSLRQDPRLYTAYADWERPLRKAVHDTAGKAEPRRLLAAAYLECWPALGDDKKTFARELMRELFVRDRRSFGQLVPDWLQVAGSRDEAFALIPDRPGAWRTLEKVYAGRRDWDSFCLAHARRLEVLEGRLQENLEEAAERLRLGDLTNSRTLCLRIVTEAPPSRRFVPPVVRALELYPPGIHGLRSTARLRGWLRWAQRLDTVAIDTLPPRAINRLADAIADLSPAEAAHAALIGRDSYRARQAELRADPIAMADWAPFLIAKARRLLATNPVDAERALDQVPPASRSTLPYWLAKRDLARARNQPQVLVIAEDELARFRKREWTALDWELLPGGAALRLLPAQPSSGLVLELLPDAATGAAVEVQWDGQVVAIQPVRRGPRIELSLAVETRPHLLEIEALSREAVTPGRVWLRDR